MPLGHYKPRGGDAGPALVTRPARRACPGCARLIGALEGRTCPLGLLSLAVAAGLTVGLSV
ncbi:MAG: hypothetical protein AVDCRST_MAG17-201 [uncultured Solirubrobacterales bacterium]|uniref:Uncharacterized protein n=1 Tax=uncultured Solirubrobacterales bacterium TaxID=768556 RepID=A0A6J4RU35_9ACTN|nr:MAG: hypothetical protein AVDCRST_MAG17-201 [uncultured Solirubrobacterales bacterium]